MDFFKDFKIYTISAVVFALLTIGCLLFKFFIGAIFAVVFTVLFIVLVFMNDEHKDKNAPISAMFNDSIFKRKLDSAQTIVDEVDNETAEEELKKHYGVK
jgi:uncharacterized membrane protein